MDYQEEQKELDKIIEKLGQGGYAALTEEEKHKFFHSKLAKTGSVRFDSKFEFFLSLFLLAVLTIHGVQRLVLAQQMGNALKLGSAINHGTANTVLNIVIGIAFTIGCGFAFITYLNDYRKNCIVFFYRKDDRKSRRKYYLQLMFIILLTALILAKTAVSWTAFIEKMGM